MKKLLFIFASLTVISCKQEPSKSGAVSDAVAADTTALQKPEAKQTSESATVATDPIAAIRQRVEHINTAKLEKKHFEFMCDEKMMVDYFYEGGEIVKIAVDFGTVGDVYAKEGYYYDNGKLVFNYEFTEGGPPCDDCIETHEYRTYIQNDKAIQYRKDKNEAPCRTCSFPATARQYKLLKAKTQEEVKAALCR
jgi:hypothetical protein